MGTKLEKINISGTTTTPHYYTGMFEYDNTRVLTLIHMDEGMTNVSHTGGTVFTNEYHIKDHLGNVRVAFSPGSTYPNQVNDYYPFGLVSYNYSSGLSSNKYLYNGKELQDDNIGDAKLEWYDYGARFYDPEIGRFTTQDPMTALHTNYTPYHYVFNNPIAYLDPVGLDSIPANNNQSNNNSQSSNTSSSSGTNSQGSSSATNSSGTEPSSDPNTTSTTTSEDPQNPNNFNGTVKHRLEYKLISEPNLSVTAISEHVAQKGSIPVTCTFREDTKKLLSTGFKTPVGELIIGQNMDAKFKPILSLSTFGIDATRTNLLLEVKIPTGKTTSAGLSISINKEEVKNAIRVAVLVLTRMGTPVSAPSVSPGPTLVPSTIPLTGNPF